MAVGLKAPSLLHPVNGIRLGASCAAIKKPGRRDLVVIELAPNTTCAALFTRNVFCAAPVQVAREHLKRGAPRLLLINTGNANAGTGAQGVQDARACCAALAQLAGCDSEQVVPFSTGVIGEPLPLKAINAGLPAAHAALSAQGWHDAAHGIMTTDTLAKGASRRLVIDGVMVTITGIAKGSGMICPDMATMLAFIATDAGAPPALLQHCLEQAMPHSFNRITVDGDTSTNDACVLMASGMSELHIDGIAHHAYPALQQAFNEVCAELAQAIVRDGEGATKFITIHVQGGAHEQECSQVAYTIAHSPLVKTAFFASDPNWGRILAAVGRAAIDGLDISKLTIYLDDVCIVRHGARAPDYQEAQGQAVMAQSEICVCVDLARGSHSSTVWTCDFSYDYVKINAEYRS